MERDEAQKSGLYIYTTNDFGIGQLSVQYRAEPEKIFPALMHMIFQKLDLHGRVAFYGTANVYHVVRMIEEVLPTLPNIELVSGYAAMDLFEEAYVTKDEVEIAQFKLAAEATCDVMNATRAFLSQHRADAQGVVVDQEGKPLTIGRVKRFIRLASAEHNLENSDGLIFAQGRDAGVPHSSGEDEAPLRTGESIVFDFFPRLLPGGYFHDVTRTWALGYALPEVQAAYDQVRHAFDLVDDALKVGDDPARYQLITCEYFESQGHPTPLSNPGTMEGYVHSLGHGVGLNIHEAPHLSQNARGEMMQPGNVFTVEPGLYYPDRGFGIRIEDTLYFDAQGTLHHLTDVPYDLVVPLNG